ncbi:hypothetical protein BpHYR1_002602 [Brachionus plicatilis]|uniref:Uncharacterized protein n=1 Tax=Brachionus plicatilis TaxID=10195 RepID=A0A3M7PT36_BRAPC|nr:hypothetical protein BpHYR1_002602 [Brachionus plicatilis]
MGTSAMHTRLNALATLKSVSSMVNSIFSSVNLNNKKCSLNKNVLKKFKKWAFWFNKFNRKFDLIINF